MSEGESVHGEPRKPIALFPQWWRRLLAAGLVSSFAVSLVERAASHILLLVIILVAVLVPLVRHFRGGRGRLAYRALPLLAFLGLLGTAAATIRIDDLSGNLIPTRVSFLWQPQRDELLMVPQQNELVEGVDLATATEDDFSQFLGPDRTNSVETELSSDWTSNVPQLVWRNEEIGAGWSGFSAVNGYALTMEQRGEKEIVSCYAIESGELVWAHTEQARHQTVPGGVGPRCTPTIYNGRVYTQGATGILLCLDGANGDVVWKKNLLEEIGTHPEEDILLVSWGRSASPLIDQGRVIIPLGLSTTGDGATLIAFDAATGDELWRKGKHQVSYASPMLTTLGGVRQIVMVCENEVCGHDADSGEELWVHPWKGSSSGTASVSQPIAVGNDRLFLSKGYAHGSALIAVNRDAGQWSANEIWHHLTVMKTKFTNAVVYDGYVYGLDDSILSCVDLETGKRIWKRGRYGHGQVLRVGSKLLVQAESGDVALVRLDTRFEELARFTPLDGKTWNNPCLYGKYLLVRNAQQAACYLMP